MVLHRFFVLASFVDVSLQVYSCCVLCLGYVVGLTDVGAALCLVGTCVLVPEFEHAIDHVGIGRVADSVCNRGGLGILRFLPNVL